MQTYVTISITSGLFESKTIENVMKVLDLFNIANEKRRLEERIDFKDFYNDAINNEINLKDHIRVWLL